MARDDRLLPEEAPGPASQHRGQDEPLVWLHGEIKTPPFPAAARWRPGLLLRLDADVGVILEVFSKKTRAAPNAILDACKRRLKEYDRA